MVLHILRKNMLKCLCRTEAQDVANILGALYIAMLFLGIINSMNVQPVVYQERTVRQHPSLHSGHKKRNSKHSLRPGCEPHLARAIVCQLNLSRVRWLDGSSLEHTGYSPRLRSCLQSGIESRDSHAACIQ